jgi:thiamine pyrophosphokinase
MLRAVVLANGMLEDVPGLRRRLAGWSPTLVIGADAGARHAAALGLRLTALLGDLDSIDPPMLAEARRNGVDVRSFPADKDETDLELALLFAVEAGADEICILGALGARIDMTLANIMLLAHPRLTGRRVEMWDAGQTVWLIRPPGEAVPGRIGDRLSLLPMGDFADGVTTHGLEYPLQGERLPLGPARGVSNVVAAENPRVELKCGLLLAILTSMSPTESAAE